MKEDNNRVLTSEEREEYCRKADEYIDMYSGFIEDRSQLAKDVSAVPNNPDFVEITNAFLDISAFTLYAFCDCMVLNKLFVKATHPYEKSFLRGKLQVQLNEGFKKLYGFKKDHKDSYCAKLEQIMPMFPGFKGAFDELLSDLEQISKDSWWKDERDAEVHIDVNKLDALRHEKINERKVAMEADQLTSLIHRFNLFTRDLYGAYFSYMKMQYIKEHGYIPNLNG